MGREAVWCGVTRAPLVRRLLTAPCPPARCCRFTATKNLVRGQSGLDSVSKVAAFVLRYFHINVEASLFSQYLTLLFIGVISANSLRNFIKNLLKFFAVVGGAPRIPPPRL